uniref:RNA-dependent RNA polymerase n=1 Tax=Rhizoctonia cerealis beny-like virus TaxID=3068664 RepID=A0AA51BS85_9VIRU|nr:MAG: RNA-dependent RNA polymerase [Rhizoctonia cerealis beny-like virus]
MSSSYQRRAKCSCWSNSSWCRKHNHQSLLSGGVCQRCSGADVSRGEKVRSSGGEMSLGQKHALAMKTCSKCIQSNGRHRHIRLNPAMVVWRDEGKEWKDFLGPYSDGLTCRALDTAIALLRAAEPELVNGDCSGGHRYGKQLWIEKSTGARYYAPSVLSSPYANWTPELLGKADRFSMGPSSHEHICWTCRGCRSAFRDTRDAAQVAADLSYQNEVSEFYEGAFLFGEEVVPVKKEVRGRWEIAGFAEVEGVTFQEAVAAFGANGYDVSDYMDEVDARNAGALNGGWGVCPVREEDVEGFVPNPDGVHGEDYWRGEEEFDAVNVEGDEISGPDEQSDCEDHAPAWWGRRQESVGDVEEVVGNAVNANQASVVDDDSKSTSSAGSTASFEGSVYSPPTALIAAELADIVICSECALIISDCDCPKPPSPEEIVRRAVEERRLHREEKRRRLASAAEARARDRGSKDENGGAGVEQMGSEDDYDHMTSTPSLGFARYRTTYPYEEHVNFAYSDHFINRSGLDDARVVLANKAIARLHRVAEEWDLEVVAASRCYFAGDYDARPDRWDGVQAFLDIDRKPAVHIPSSAVRNIDVYRPMDLSLVKFKKALRALMVEGSDATPVDVVGFFSVSESVPKYRDEGFNISAHSSALHAALFAAGGNRKRALHLAERKIAYRRLRRSIWRTNPALRSEGENRRRRLNSARRLFINRIRNPHRNPDRPSRVARRERRLVKAARRAEENIALEGLIVEGDNDLLGLDGYCSFNTLRRCVLARSRFLELSGSSERCFVQFKWSSWDLLKVTSVLENPAGRRASWCPYSILKGDVAEVDQSDPVVLEENRAILRRLLKKRPMRDWGAEVIPSVLNDVVFEAEHVEDGLCYLGLLEAAEREGAKSALGEWPKKKAFVDYVLSKNLLVANAAFTKVSQGWHVFPVNNSEDVSSGWAAIEDDECVGAEGYVVPQDVKRKAWIGDAELTLMARKWARSVDQVFTDRATNKTAHRLFVRSFHPEILPPGNEDWNDHTISAYFEAVYCDDMSFRHDYWTWLMGSDFGPFEPVPELPGLCYLACFRSEFWREAFSRLGSWPLMRDVVRVSISLPCVAWVSWSFKGDFYHFSADLSGERELVERVLSRTFDSESRAGDASGVRFPAKRAVDLFPSAGGAEEMGIDVGGEHDCWMKFFGGNESLGYAECDECWAKPGGCEACDFSGWSKDGVESVPETKPLDELRMILEFCLEDVDPEVANVEVRFTSATRLHIFSFCTSARPLSDTVLSLQQFVSGVLPPRPVAKAVCTHPKAPKGIFIASFASLLCPDCSAHGADVIEAASQIMVGDGIELINTAMTVLGPELARTEAGIQFNNEINSTPTIPFLMSEGQQREFFEYVGRSVRCAARKSSWNDHLMLEASRHLVREQLFNMFPHNSDMQTVLHLGSTGYDINKWWHHNGHDFQLAMRDDKDNARVFEDICKRLANKLRDTAPPSLATLRTSNVRLTFSSFGEIVRSVSLDGRQRILLPGGDEVRRYNMLIFEDALYDVPQSDLADHFVRTGAEVGYATMFFPHAMIDPNVEKSKIYSYEEYFSPAVTAAALADHCWPSILALSPLLPLGDLARFIHKIIGTMSDYGWDIFKRWLTGLTTDKLPLEYLFGSLTDVWKVMPIFQQVFDNLRPVFRKYCMRVKVTWRGGFSNGYDHAIQTWEAWLNRPRITHSSGVVIDSEIVTRVGEMYLIRFFRSSGAKPITRSISLPLSMSYVRVADLRKAWHLHSRTFSEFSYVSVRAETWYRMLNWCLAQPIETLDYNVLMNAINRVSKGLSVGSNIIAPKAPHEESENSVLAIALLMETFKQHSIISTIENDPDLKKGYETNLEQIVRQIAKTGLAIVTGGLAIPFFFIARYLLSITSTYDYVLYPVPVESITQKAVNSGAEPRLPQGPFEFVVPPLKNQFEARCDICEFQKAGFFSENGQAGDGQCFHLTNHDADNHHDISFTDKTVQPLVDKVRDARNWHNGKGAVKLANIIHKFEDWLEGNISGIKGRVQIDHIKGGPGTGKSEIIKALLYRYGKQGISAAVTMPFAELAGEYKNCSVLGVNGKHEFISDTIWYTLAQSNVKVLIVDECTGVDWSLIKGIACYIGAERIILVGDRDQTHLRLETGEGCDPTNKASGLDWSRIPEHELVYNYRLGAWRVKLLNLLFGYRMISKRGDRDEPEFVSIAQYLAMKHNMVVDREIVFSHGTAELIFGAESSSDKSSGLMNMSVRSKQGMTYNTVAVGLSQGDQQVIEVEGMLCVAISRSRYTTLIVYAGDENDPVVTQLKTRLQMDNEATRDAVWKLPYPLRPDNDVELKMTDETARMDNLINQKIAANEAIIESPPGEEDKFVRRVQPLGKNVNIDLPSQEIEGLKDDELVSRLKLYYSSIFGTCLFDALRGQRGLSDAEIDRSLVAFYESVFSDDILMGRSAGTLASAYRDISSFVRGDARTLSKGFPNLRFTFEGEETSVLTEVYTGRARNQYGVWDDQSSLRGVNMNIVMNYVSDCFSSVVVVDDQTGQVNYRSQDLELGESRASEVILIAFNPEHAVGAPHELVEVKLSTSPEIRKVSSRFIHDGLWVKDYPYDEQLKCYILSAVPRRRKLTGLSALPFSRLPPLPGAPKTVCFAKDILDDCSTCDGKEFDDKVVQSRKLLKETLTTGVVHKMSDDEWQEVNARGILRQSHLNLLDKSKYVLISEGFVEKIYELKRTVDLDDVGDCCLPVKKLLSSTPIVVAEFAKRVRFKVEERRLRMFKKGQDMAEAMVQAVDDSVAEALAEMFTSAVGVCRELWASGRCGNRTQHVIDLLNDPILHGEPEEEEIVPVSRAVNFVPELQTVTKTAPYLDTERANELHLWGTQDWQNYPAAVKLSSEERAIADMCMHLYLEGSQGLHSGKLKILFGADVVKGRNLWARTASSLFGGLSNQKQLVKDCAQIAEDVCGGRDVSKDALRMLYCAKPNAYLSPVLVEFFSEVFSGLSESKPKGKISFTRMANEMGLPVHAAAIAASAYSYKTTMAERYPDWFIDIDTLVDDLIPDIEHLRPETDVEGAWDEYNAAVVRHVYGKVKDDRRILLVHHPSFAKWFGRALLGAWCPSVLTHVKPLTRHPHRDRSHKNCFNEPEVFERVNPIKLQAKYIQAAKDWFGPDVSAYGNFRKVSPWTGKPMPSRADDFDKSQHVRVHDPGLSPSHRLIAAEMVDFNGAWMYRKTVLKEPLPKQPKITSNGKDSFRLSEFVVPKLYDDPARLNEAGACVGMRRPTNATISWEGDWFEKNKSGNIRKSIPNKFNSIGASAGNFFDVSPVETLNASERIGQLRRKPVLTGESKAWARSVAERTYRECWKASAIGVEEYNRCLFEGWAAARQRNYGGRADAEFLRSFGEPVLYCNNKKQFKPEKNGKLDLLKTGQLIVQSPPDINLKFMGLMRFRGRQMKDTAQDHFFLDDYEDPEEFNKRLTAAIVKLPKCARFAVMDFEEYDSQQSSVTVEIEKQLALLSGIPPLWVHEYYLLREKGLKFVFPGLFSGRMNEEKGSGFLDTKSGNTNLATALSTVALKGLGPKVKAGKGDDVCEIQAALQECPKGRREIKIYTGMNYKLDIGTGGEFIGNTVTRAGCFGSITRVAKKAIAHRSRDYAQFCEYQKSLREQMARWNVAGLEETIASNCDADKATETYVQTCYDFVASLAYIGEKQWRDVVKERTENKFPLRGAEGPYVL